MPSHWFDNRPQRMRSYKPKEGQPVVNRVVLTTQVTLPVITPSTKLVWMKVPIGGELINVLNEIPRGRDYQAATRFKFFWLVPADRPHLVRHAVNKYLIVPDSTTFSASKYLTHVTSLASLTDPSTNYFHIFEDHSE